jgi:transposase
VLIQHGKQPEFAMPIPLRTDFDASLVRIAARKSKDGAQARRLLTLAAIYEGASRTEAARIGGVTVQIIRDWVVKFNASGPAGLIDRKAPGQPSRLSPAHRVALVETVELEPCAQFLRGDRPAKGLLVRLMWGYGRASMTDAA